MNIYIYIHTWTKNPLYCIDIVFPESKVYNTVYVYIYIYTCVYVRMYEYVFIYIYMHINLNIPFVSKYSMDMIPHGTISYINRKDKKKTHTHIYISIFPMLIKTPHGSWIQSTEGKRRGTSCPWSSWHHLELLHPWASLGLEIRHLQSGDHPKVTKMNSTGCIWYDLYFKKI